MEFFEKLGKKASETYKSAAEKTNKLASETKLKLKISDNKSKIKDIYTEIGKKVYQKYTLDGNLCIKDDIKEELERIDELSNEIKEFERQKLELSDIKQCANCKNEIDVSAKFCPNCGAEQPEIKEPEAQEVEVVEEENCCSNKDAECECKENAECNCNDDKEQTECDCSEENTNEEKSECNCSNENNQEEKDN